jgi:hypothetical protein
MSPNIEKYILTVVVTLSFEAIAFFTWLLIHFKHFKHFN